MHKRDSRVLPALVVFCLAASPIAACRRGTPDAKPSSGAAPPAVSEPTRAGTTTPSAVPAAAAPHAPGSDATPLASRLTDLAKTLAPEDEILSEREKRLTTVDAAFAYVRDNVGFESYDGILRGADGTFHTRAGNALDRSMLLAAILESQKVPVRLVTGQLPPAVAERLFNRIFEPPVTRRSAARGPMSAEAAALKDRILARAHRDYDAILKVLGHSMPAVAMPSHGDLVEEIKAHAWLQAQVHGQWVDLDPSFQDSTIGHAYTAVERTYSGPPAALMQQVTIRVITEALDGNTLTHEVVLQKSLPAYQIIDKQVFLAHMAKGLGNIFSGTDVRQPVLVINGKPKLGKPIDFGSGSSAAAANGAQGGALSGVLGAFGAPQKSAGPVFVAEWLEFELDFPSGRKDVSRRVIFDRGGTAWRRASTHDPAKLTPVEQNAKLGISQTFYNIWFSAGRHNLLAFSTVAEALAQGMVPAAHPDNLTFQERVWPFAMRDLSWFIASDHLIVPLLNDTPGLRFYADSPRIFVWSAKPAQGGPANALAMESDLRRDTLRAVAKDSSVQSAAAQHKLWFGVLEGAMEHELGAPPDPNASISYVTTSALAESGNLVVVTQQTVSTIPVNDVETEARLRAAVASGDTLVVPRRVLDGGMSGWWQISKRTGEARAVVDDDLNFGKSVVRFDPNFGGTRQPGGRFYYPYEEYRPPPPDPPEEEEGAGEFGEYNLTNEVSLIWGEQPFQLIAAMVVECVTVSLVTFAAINQL